MGLSKFIPALQWKTFYNTTLLKGDLSAGLTVGVMLIPQGMAYSMLAGLDPIYGLYASIIPLVVYALLGTSRQLAVGPVAMVALLIAAGIGPLANDPGTYAAYAILLALMVGVIQLLMGVFKMGFLVNFLSHPVISGFTSAAALIIGLSQLKHLLGINIPRSHHVHEIIVNAASNISQIHLATLILGLLAIAVIIALKKINKSIPGPLVAVILGILSVYLLGLNETGMKIVGTVPGGLPSFALPQINLETIQALIPTALTISLIGFMESFAVAKAIEAKHKNYKVSANQELIALGMANIAGSMFKAFPTTGGFSRTAVNDQAGAKTGIASIISAVLIALTLLFLTPLFYFLPKAILASVIMVAVFGLIDFKEAFHLWKVDKNDFFMLIVTFVGTLTLGIEQGIGIGVILSLIAIIWRTTRPHIAVLGLVPNTKVYRNIDRFDDVEETKNKLIIRPDARLYFANIQYFREQVEQLIEEKGEDLKVLIINAESINSLDSSAMHMLEDLTTQLEVKQIPIYFVGVKGPVRDILQISGLTQRIGEEHFFLTVNQAVECFDTKEINNFGAYTLQSEGN